jgi:hypothetical protein
MKRITAILFATWMSATGVGAYTIDLTLYNTSALLNYNGITALTGTTSGGNYVQLILAGANGIIDTPDIYGTPSGDDTLLTTTYVGAGLPSNPNQGLLEQNGIMFDSSLVNTPVYVRFWNGNTMPAATYYGNSDLFFLPNGDMFNQAALDFVPNATYADIANTPFSAHITPEPSNLFLIGLLILAGWRFWIRRHVRNAAILSVVLAAMVANANAQGLRRFDIAASRPIHNTDNAPLPGTNPNSDAFGFTVTPGCLVQILNVGTNGIPDLPKSDGSPGGDDTVVATATIGQGIAPSVSRSGQFSISIYPSLPDGTIVYARAFNAPTVAGATTWGQSATFDVSGVTVMDVSKLGLSGTYTPKGVDLNTVDAKGLTYLQELIAGTNPNDPNDIFKVDALSTGNTGTTVKALGRAGRSYVLQRTTDPLGTGAQWNDIQTVAPLSTDTNLLLQDPAPPNTDHAFYRIRVLMP